jgi:hypothetical protein
MKRLVYYAGFILLVAAMGSCKKDAEKSTLNIRLTDDPGPYSEVNIDLRAIEVTGDSAQTVMLDVTPDIINLLDFSNGVDTLVGTGLLEPGKVEQIRLILGPNNTVKVDGTTYPLSTPSAEQSGLKLQVHRTFEAGVEYNILLDFDAHHSIVKTGNGNYKLKPVVRTIITAESGSIRGKITPAGTVATAVATSGTDSYSGPANASGDFLIMGLPPGTYSVSIIHELSTTPVVREGVVVTVGNTTNIGTIEL